MENKQTVTIEFKGFKAQRKLTFMHENQCCEDVYLEDFEDDVKEGEPIKFLNIEISYKESEDDSICESKTWSFIRIKTDRGDVFMRWFGESNGYYSERPSIIFE